MAISNSASTVTDGLVFYMDAGNKKSWIGPPVTNLLSNKTFSGDWAFSGASYDAPTQRLVTNTSTVSHFCYLDTTLVNLSTYTQSVVAKAAQRSVLQITPSIGLDGYLSNKYVNFDLSSGIMYGNATDNCKMDHLGDGWFRCSYRDVAYADGAGRFVLGIVPSYTSGRLAAYADTANYGIYLKQPQLEASPFASPFIDGSRANTECILDLTNNATVEVQNLNYNNDTTFNFNKIDSQITVSNSIDYSNGFTLNAWIKPIDAGENAYGRIFDKSSSTNALNGFGLWMNNGTQIAFVVNNGTLINTSIGSYNVWKNVCVTCTNLGETKVYVNGAQISTGTTGAVSGITTSNLLTIGNRSGTSDRTFNGYISTAQIYESVLTSESVMQNFSALRGRYGI